jgi:hypothetical protein
VCSAGVFHTGEGQPLAEEEVELGAIGRVRRRGGAVAGWMALAMGQMDSMTTAEQRESDCLEDKVTGYCRWAFESDKRGAWLGLEARVLTWERLRVAAVSDLGYQALVTCLPDDHCVWPKEVGGMERYSDILSSVD